MIEINAFAAPSGASLDVSQIADTSLGHIKVHFCVNGAGLLTRQVLTATSYATHPLNDRRS
jgi:hypothetical protein